MTSCLVVASISSMRATSKLAVLPFAHTASAAAFALAGSPIARDALVAEAGLDFAVAANASLGVSWTGQFADKAYDNTVKGNFTWRF